MVAHLAYVPVSIVILFALASAISCAQGTLDVSLTTAYMINATNGHDSSSNAVEIWGPIEIFKSGSSAYVNMPTNAPAGSKLAFFQDTSTGALFRNNTLMLAISGPSGPAASMALMTGDMTSDGTRFYGQITDVELDTVALADEDSMAGVVLYLNKWPDHPSYRVSISNNATVKRAVAAEASKSGQADNVKLMLDVTGDSIGYVIVHMKAPEASGNVSAYRYSDGSVTRLTCKAIRSNESIVYETISNGGGTFAFAGDFPGSTAAGADMRDVLVFTGALGAVLLLLVGSVVTAFKKLSKKS